MAERIERVYIYVCVGGVNFWKCLLLDVFDLHLRGKGDVFLEHRCVSVCVEDRSGMVALTCNLDTSFCSNCSFNLVYRL